MPKFEITFKETTMHRCIVEADTIEEAVTDQFNPQEYYLGPVTMEPEQVIVRAVLLDEHGKEAI